MQALGSDDFDPLAMIGEAPQPNTPPILTKKQQQARELQKQKTTEKLPQQPSESETVAAPPHPPAALSSSNNKIEQQVQQKQQPSEWEQIVSTAGTLLPGEQVHMYLGSVCLTSSDKLQMREVACVMTTYRLAFAEISSDSSTANEENNLQLPLGYISTVSTDGLGDNNSNGGINGNYDNNDIDSRPSSTRPATVIVDCKDGRWLRITPPTAGEAKRAEAALSTFAFPGKSNLEFLFAFECRKVGFSPPAGAHFIEPYQAEKEYVGERTVRTKLKSEAMNVLLLRFVAIVFIANSHRQQQ